MKCLSRVVRLRFRSTSSFSRPNLAHIKQIALKTSFEIGSRDETLKAYFRIQTFRKGCLSLEPFEGMVRTKTPDFLIIIRPYLTVNEKRHHFKGIFYNPTTLLVNPSYHVMPRHLKFGKSERLFSDFFPKIRKNPKITRPGWDCSDADCRLIAQT